MQSKRSVPVWGLWIVGSLFVLLAVASGLVSLYINVTAGLSVGVTLAIMFAFSDISKVLLPMVCQATGWNKQMRITYLAASAVSIICALYGTAEMFGLKLAEVGATAQKAAISQSMVTEIKSSVTNLREMAAVEGKQGGCGPKCQSLLDLADEKEKSLVQAMRSQKQDVKPTTTGLAYVFSLAGIAPKTTDLGSSIVLSLLGILMLELVCHLAGPAAAYISRAMQIVRERREAVALDEKKAAATAKRKRTRAANKAAATRAANKTAREAQTVVTAKSGTKQPAKRNWTAAQTRAYLDRTLNKETAKV